MMLQTRVSPELLDRIDRWRLTQGLPVLSRAEAVRKLLERALDAADTEATNVAK